MSPAAALVPPSAQRVFDIRQQGKYKIGFFGMVSMDWDVHSTNVLDDLPKEHKEFLVSEAKSSAKVLRTEYRVDLVVAVTNMRLAEDLLLSGATQEKGLERVDFIFGGYDREAVGTFYPELVMQSQHSEGESKGKVGSGRYEVTSPEIRVVKSGAAWEGLSVVEMCVKKEGEDLPELDSVKGRPLSSDRRLEGECLTGEARRGQNCLCEMGSPKSRSMARGLKSIFVMRKITPLP